MIAIAIKVPKKKATRTTKGAKSSMYIHPHPTTSTPPELITNHKIFFGTTHLLEMRINLISILNIYL